MCMVYSIRILTGSSSSVTLPLKCPFSDVVDRMMSLLFLLSVIDLSSILFIPVAYDGSGQGSGFTHSSAKKEVVMQNIHVNQRAWMIDRLSLFSYRLFPLLFCFFCVIFFVFLSFSIIEVYSIKQMVSFGNEISIF